MQNQLTFSVITELENVEKKSSVAFLKQFRKGKGGISHLEMSEFQGVFRIVPLNCDPSFSCAPLI